MKFFLAFAVLLHSATVYRADTANSHSSDPELPAGSGQDTISKRKIKMIM